MEGEEDHQYSFVIDTNEEQEPLSAKKVNQSIESQNLYTIQEQELVFEQTDKHHNAAMGWCFEICKQRNLWGEIILVLRLGLVVARYPRYPGIPVSQVSQHSKRWQD